MSKFTDSQYLKTQEYRTSANLSARIALHELFSTNTYDWHRWLFDQVEAPENCQLLELGTGRADIWVKNQDRVPAGWDITLTDLSPGMLQDAKQHLGEQAAHYQYRVVDAQAIPFADETFDVVFANHMLYHVEDRPGALSEIRRVLKAGGTCYASTLNEVHTVAMIQLTQKYLPGVLYDRDELGFTLDNGTAQLAPFFETVTIHRLENSLHITEPQPLVDFMLTLTTEGVRLTPEQAQTLTRQFQIEIATHGAIDIPKDSGTFIARRA